MNRKKEDRNRKKEERNRERKGGRTSNRVGN